MTNTTYTFSKLFAVMALALTFSACDRGGEDPGDAPESDFTASVQGMDVTFTFTGSGTVDDYAWDFGDGESSSDANPTHTYAAGGSYEVTLEVSNDNGTDESTQTVEIESASTATNPELNLGDADGAVYAINTISITEVQGFEIETKLGVGVAWFTDGTSFVDVGTVSWAQGSNGADLTRNDNNSYTYTETTIPSEGFNSNGGVTWSIDGGNGHGSINGLSNGWPFPSTKKISETNSNISGSAEYTITHDGSITDADSSYFSIYGADGSVMKRVDGTTTSVTISASEMATLGTGSAIIQIASFNIYSTELGGKKYYAVNESVATKQVTID